MNQFEYMKLMPFIEPVFYDDMGTVDSIIKAIQTYQEDENFVPKVKGLPGIYGTKVNNGVIFTIDSASMDVNHNAVHYDIELIANAITIGRKHLHEYMIKVTAACNMPYKEPILVSGYALVTRDVCDVIPFIEKGMFDKMLCDILGNVAWRIQQYCLKDAKKYIVKCNSEYWLNKNMDKPKRDPIADLDPDSLMMEPELLWHPMEENKNGENKET